MTAMFNAHPARSYRANMLLTALFVAVCVVGVIGRRQHAVQIVFVAVSVALFAVGVVAALWAYARSLERSRTQEVGVANIYLLSGGTAPKAVKRDMSIALGIQVLASLTAAIFGTVGLASDDLNALAFGTLVPMLGIGLNGAWGAAHGTFGPRLGPRRTRPNHRKID